MDARSFVGAGYPAFPPLPWRPSAASLCPAVSIPSSPSLLTSPGCHTSSSSFAFSLMPVLPFLLDDPLSLRNTLNFIHLKKKNTTAITNERTLSSLLSAAHDSFLIHRRDSLRNAYIQASRILRACVPFLLFSPGPSLAGPWPPPVRCGVLRRSPWAQRAACSVSSVFLFFPGSSV